MAATTVAPAARYIGVTDECVECQQCGKVGLRSTVVLGLLDADGNVDEVTYYGSDCAARALGVGGGARKVLAAAREADRTTRALAADARDRAAHYGYDPVTGEITTARSFAEIAVRRRRLYVGSPWAADMTWQDWQDAAREMIARDVAAVAAERLLDGVRPAAAASAPTEEPAAPVLVDGAPFELAPVGALF
jgi:hypothetical protein